MPEYLAPGVYVEETSFRAKSIEGVATSTTGFVGPCRFGPTSGPPVLVTSFEEFRRRFGGLDPLVFDGIPTINYMSHAVKAFFENGGKRVFVARIIGLGADTLADHTGFVAIDGSTWFRARFPGVDGNVRVRVTARRSRNLHVGGRLVGLRPGDLVEQAATERSSIAAPADTGGDALVQANLAWVQYNDSNEPVLYNAGGEVAGPLLDSVQRVSLTVEVLTSERFDVYPDLSTHPSASAFIGNILRDDHPADTAARIYLDYPEAYGTDDFIPLAATLAGIYERTLVNGADGHEPTSTDFAGAGTGDAATGMEALAEESGIAIVAAPGSSALTNVDEQRSVRDSLIGHCERMRYRFAILSGSRDLDDAGIREVRAQHDSTYAALYYPWVVTRDPLGQAGDVLTLPPEGFMAGIYARSDVERGVHKAPANEIVRGALRFSRPVSHGVQEVLNPEGINCLRFFEGRGYRVWGARTISSDPEWKYINVRRLFIFLEHSIDRSTQWAVFEPNNAELWLKIRLTVESFLTDVWRTGALLGKSPEEAYFVRCDRTTMTQGDLDNGRLICLIGVAPTKPAEFVIFRIGQWTADASII